MKTTTIQIRSILIAFCLVLTSQITLAQSQKLVLSTNMVVDEKSSGYTASPATMLVNEQSIANDPKANNGGVCTESWMPSWTSGDYPWSCYIDLGATTQITDIYLFDHEWKAGDFTVSYGTPGNWTELFTDGLNRNNEWFGNSVAITTQYIRFTRHTTTSFVDEIVIYGSTGPQGPYTLNVGTACEITNPSSPSVYDAGTSTSIQWTSMTAPFPTCAFSYWEEDGVNIGTNNPMDIIMNSDRTIAAITSPITYYNINLIPMLDGATSGAGGTASYSGTGVVTENTTTTLTASVNEGYLFKHWLDDNDNILSSSNPYDLWVTQATDIDGDGNINLKGVFELEPVQYTISYMNTGCFTMGPFSSDKFEGEEMTLSLYDPSHPLINCKFDYWICNQTGDTIRENPYTFTVTEDATFTGVSIGIDYKNVSVAALPDYNAGTISYSSDGSGYYFNTSYEAGVGAILTATANSGYSFVQWLDANNNVLSSNNPYSFTVTDNISLTAEFEEIINADPILLSINPSMIIDENTGGYSSSPAGNLADEQASIGDPKTGTGNVCSTDWMPSWTGDDYPWSCYIDLGSIKQITDIYLFDQEWKDGDLTVSYGSPGNWTELFTDPLTANNVWVGQAVSASTQYIRFTRHTTTSFVNEIAIYGIDDNPSLEYTLTLNANNATFMLLPDQETYTEGTNVVVTVQPNAGYIFSNISGDLSSAENPISITMDSDKTLNAAIEKTDSINGNFENRANNLPLSWTADPWLVDKAIMTYEIGNGMNASNCIAIENTDLNDSRWIQTINVKPYTEYKISGYIRTENVGDISLTGATIGILGSWDHSNEVEGTSDWTYTELTLTTGSESQLPIACRLGHNGSTVTGKAWFDDVVIEEINHEENTDFLIIVANPIYETGIINTALDTYISDITTEGWTPKIITVNRAVDANADYDNLTERELKAIIKTYYTNGLQGFFIIGSPNHVPTAYWKSHQMMTVSGYTNDPTDLYYADMDEWINIDNETMNFNGEDIEVFENYYSTMINGSWERDQSRPANPENEYFIPELIYGRIAAGPISSSDNEEATKATAYLNKIHNYRINGSNLPETAQNKTLVIANDSYCLSKGWGIDFAKHATNNIEGIFDIDMTNSDNIQTKIEEGAKFLVMISHSGNDSHAITKWEKGERFFDGFDLSRLSNGNPKIHHISGFNCHAAQFNVPNFGATYTLDTQYGLTYIGSSGGWGIVPDEEYIQSLNANITVGESFRSMMAKWGTENHDTGIAKGVLHGDPLLKYPTSKTNKTPWIETGFQYQEATVGIEFSLPITTHDEEGDNVIVEALVLPSGATFANNIITWTPSNEQEGNEYIFELKATDTEGNTYIEEFEIYVSRLKNSLLIDQTNWTVSGTGNTYSTSNNVNLHPFKPVQHLCMETNNSWLSLSQTINLEANSQYELVSWLLNINVNLSQNVYIRIPEIDKNYAIIGGTPYDHIFNSIFFNTEENTSITIELHAGDAGMLMTGKVYFTGIRLNKLETFNPNVLLQNGDFEDEENSIPDYWTSNAFKPSDAIFSYENNEGIDGTNCVSINNTANNDSRYVQTITLEPNTEYTISGYIKTENVGPLNYTGASFGIYSTYIHCPEVEGTMDWTYRTFNYTTDATGVITIACRLGHNGSIVTGKAWFDNISVTEASATQEWSLSINTTNGTVSLDPNQTTYTDGSTVTLTATPNTGYTFESWTGDLTGNTNPAIITIDADKNITANFILVQSGTSEKIVLNTEMLTDETGSYSSTPATNLIDEQSLAGDPRENTGGTMVNMWLPSWTASDFPKHCYIDLGQAYAITDIYIYDQPWKDGEAEISYGTPGNWTSLFTDDLTRNDEWFGNTVDITTQYIRISMNHVHAHMDEVVLYGYPVGASRMAERSIENAISYELELYAYPNPFESSVKIEYSIPVKDDVSISIYDMQGNLIEQLVKGLVDEGIDMIEWEKYSLSKGIYLVRFQTSSGSKTIKLIKQ